MERDSSYLKVAIQSPYPLRRNSPDGVKEFIVGLKPHLEQKGCIVRVIGPSIKEKSGNLADFKFGSTFNVSHDQTTHAAPLSFRKRRAQRLMQTVMPDIVVLHEPLVVGHAAHTLISGMPRRIDGKTVPAVIG